MGYHVIYNTQYPLVIKHGLVENDLCSCLKATIYSAWIADMRSPWLRLERKPLWRASNHYHIYHYTVWLISIIIYHIFQETPKRSKWVCFTPDAETVNLVGSVELRPESLVEKSVDVSSMVKSLPKTAR
jgi:hypothetical protein